MIFVVLLLFHACTGTNEGEDIVTFPGSSVCNETILLGTTHDAAVIDFRIYTFSLDPKNYLCSFHVQTVNTPYVGMKFLSTYIDNPHSNVSQCSSELNISGKDMELTHYNSFPENEISVHTYGYMTVKLKLFNCTINSDDTYIFQLVVFEFGDIFCFKDEIRCLNSTRCVHEELTCSNVYDFCDNNLLNCNSSSDDDVKYERNRRTGPPSIPGIFLGSVCLVVLVTFLLYIIACRKRPCFRKITEKLLCRSPLCQNSSDQRAERMNVSATFTSETQDVSFNYTRFRDPPPNYNDIHTNHIRQNESENHLPQTGSAYNYFQNGARNIPPPYYSAEDADETENVQHELPPPYSVAVSSEDELQHI